MTNAVLVFDIGGTSVRCAAFFRGEMLGKKTCPTPKRFSDAVKVCLALSEEVLSGNRPYRAVIGVAGTFDAEKRRLFRIPQLPEWNGVAMADEMERAFRCPVMLENDAALGALGEATRGAGRNARIVGYVTLGTSIGGARTVDGTIDVNISGFEPGHQLVSLGTETKKWFAWVSGSAIEKETGLRGEEIVDMKMWDEWSRRCAIGLTNVALLWSPNILVLGGSVGRRMNLGVIEGELRTHLDVFPQIPRIVFAELGDDSGLWGGASLANSE